MLDFPKLKTGAVMQYPGAIAATYDTAVLRFIDGSEQRFPQRGQAGRRWRVALETLDDAEAVRLGNFHHAVQTSGESFRFEDPLSGLAYEGCRFEGKAAKMKQDAINRNAVEVTVVWNGE